MIYDGFIHIYMIDMIDGDQKRSVRSVRSSD